MAQRKHTKSRHQYERKTPWRKQINLKTRKNHKHKPCVPINYATREFTWCVCVCSSAPAIQVPWPTICAQWCFRCIGSNRLGRVRARVPRISLVSLCSIGVPSWHALSFCSNLINTHSSLGAKGLFHICINVVRLYLKCTAHAAMLLPFSSSSAARILHNFIIASCASDRTLCGIVMCV